MTVTKVMVTSYVPDKNDTDDSDSDTGRTRRNIDSGVMPSTSRAASHNARTRCEEEGCAHRGRSTRNRGRGGGFICLPHVYVLEGTGH